MKNPDINDVKELLREAIVVKNEDNPNFIEQTLDARGKRYGVFTGHAKVTQDLKKVIALELSLRNKTLADDQQEALDMIVHKIGRIVNGDANYADSWIDIAGYAKLVADRLEGVER